MAVTKKGSEHAQVFTTICRAENILQLLRNDFESLRFPSPSFCSQTVRHSHSLYMAQAPADAVENGDQDLKPPLQKSNETGDSNKQSVDPDAQAMVISSLRSQIQDLFSQVTQLNNKLVQSYDRVSNLEDDLHLASSTIRASSLKVSQLELERTQHLSALNTGLLVEKSHVTSELTRLMEKATEEAAQRGQAETARADIEKELDDLSANLFQQANSMVAEARFARSLSERKVEDAERALKGTEEAVAIMQLQMQTLKAEKEQSDRSAENMRALMGKGKWVEKSAEHSSVATLSLRLISSHVPYQEFLLFVAHLRSIHPSSPQPPAMTTLLSLPFLSRLLAEDSEPTVRLDLAPSLNWLSRRSVLSAIHTGQLNIEPVSSGALLQEPSASYSNSSIPGTNSSNTNISCALCGTAIFPASQADTAPSRPANPLSSLTLGLSRNNSSSHVSNNSWSSAIFKSPLSSSAHAYDSPPPTPPRSNSRTPVLQYPPNYPQQIHIFRLTSQSSTSTLGTAPSALSLSSSLPITTSQASHQSNHNHSQHQSRSSVSSTIYPLCTSGWCLTRLRATCSLWAFVRTGIVEKIWEEEVPVIPSPIPEKIAGKVGAPPPVPPRRRGLWGMASALGERAASWGEGDKKDAKVPEKQKPLPPEKTPEEQKTPEKLRRLPPPPTHPSLSHPSTTVPPPLPRRSDGRGRISPSIVTTPERVKATTDGEINGGGDEPKPEKTDAGEVVAVPDSSSEPTAKAPEDAREQVESTAAPATTVHNGEANETVGSPHDNSGAVETETLVDATPKSPQEAQIPSSDADESMGSQEAFSTPTEEVSSNPLNAPDTVPAPSSPDSIIAASEPVQNPPIPVQLPQPTIQSPKLSPTTETANSKTPAPVPPPLPRRAAARGARPLSTTVTVPVPAAAEAVNPETDSPKQDPPMTPRASQFNPADMETVPTIEVANGFGIRETESDAESVTKSDAASVSIYSSSTAQDKEVDDSPFNKAVDSETTEPVQVNGDVSGDREVYVGHITWEERTWKELVKLREDMFWARIGGLR